MSVAHFSHGALIASTPFINLGGIQERSLVAHVRDRVLPYETPLLDTPLKATPSPKDSPLLSKIQRAFESCAYGLIGGAAGSIVAKSPLPFLAGLGGCFPIGLAQQKVGSEFQANTYTTGNQHYASVSGLSNGDFVVVWDSNGQDGNLLGVFGQVFNAMGAKIGSEFQVNTYTTGDQKSPSVSSLSNGDFVVTWMSSDQDGSFNGVFGQRFNATGAQVGSEFQVNTHTSGSQWSPSVSTLSNGNFVVAWWDESGQDGNGYGVFGQLFNATGAQVGSEFQVNTYTLGDQYSPFVSSLSNGNFVVVWGDSSGRDGDVAGVFGKIFNATGAQVGSEFQVNTYTAGDQSSPSVSPLSDGGFVVAWEDRSGQDGNLFGVFRQLFNETGAKIGSEFQVNSYTTNHQYSPSVASLSNGNFIVTWHSDTQEGDNWGVYGRLFDAAGSVLGNEFLINTHTTLEQQFPSVAGLSNGDFVVTWESQGQDGDGFGVYGQIFRDNITQSLTTGITAITATSGTTGSTPSIATTGTSGTTGFTGSIGSAGTSGITAASTGSQASDSSTLSSSNSIFWLWPVLGAVGGATCLAATGYVLVKQRTKGRDSEFSSVEELEEKDSSTASRSSMSPHRKEGHTEIGGKYALINKISRREAGILFDQTGIEVTFAAGKNKAKILLGEGNFGKLRIARSLETDLFAGVKKIKGAKAIQESRDEGALQAKLEGKPNIMPIWDYVESLSSADEPVLYQFMPLAGFGNGEELQAHLHAAESVQPEVLTHVAQGVANGLYHMHRAGIYHLDIKLSNLVLDMKGEVFVIDFGCAKEFKDGQIHEPVIGDTRYFSPERLNISRQRAHGGQPEPIAADKVDAWALGLTILELVTGDYPFDQCDIMEKHTKWDAEYFQEKLGAIEFLQQPGGLNEIVKELLDVNPDTRLGIKEARNRLRHLEAFSRKGEQEAFFVRLKKEEVDINPHFVSRDQDPNYADVYYAKHKNAELIDYQALDSANEYLKTPSATKNEYSKTPASVGNSSSSE